MTPNRKQLLDVVDPLVNVGELVQAKYSPLTSLEQPQQAVQRQQVTPSAAAAAAAASDNYWSWPAEKVAQDEKEPAVDLFSASHLEANLVPQSKSLRAAEKTIVKADHEETSSSYWSERVEAHQQMIITNQANQAMSDRMGYWDMPADDRNIKDTQIALILKEEFTRIQLSADTMEQRLQKAAAAQQRKNISSNKSHAEHDSYWQWESPTTIHADAGTINESYWTWEATDTAPEEDQRQQLIASILQYEVNRHLFSADHFQSNLQQSSCCTAAAAATKPQNDDY